MEYHAALLRLRSRRFAKGSARYALLLKFSLILPRQGRDRARGLIQWERRRARAGADGPMGRGVRGGTRGIEDAHRRMRRRAGHRRFGGAAACGGRVRPDGVLRSSRSAGLSGGRSVRPCHPRHHDARYGRVRVLQGRMGRVCSNAAASRSTRAPTRPRCTARR